MLAPFEFSRALDYLDAQIRSNKTVYRYKSSLSEAAGCQLSYLSQVLAGKAQLNPDHAAGLSGFWGHSDFESDFESDDSPDLDSDFSLFGPEPGQARLPMARA